MNGVHLYCQPPPEEKWSMISRNPLALKSFTCRYGLKQNWKLFPLVFLLLLTGITVSKSLVEYPGMY